MLLLPAPSIDASRDRTDSRSLAAPTGRTAQTQAMPPSQPTASRTRAATSASAASSCTGAANV
ncbi:hypothetical protein J8J21_20195, partial [Mycobacterium tuberculosis]